MSGKKGCSGKPKTFESAEELLDLWYEFCSEIMDMNYIAAPTKTEFSRWLIRKGIGGDRRTVNNALAIYFPEARVAFREMQADVIAGGALLNKYQPTASKFTLGNLCDWRDQTKTEVEYGEETRKALTTAEKMQMIREAVEDYAEH
jgi:hypothetical protein